MQEYWYQHLEVAWYILDVAILFYYLPWYISLLVLAPITVKVYTRLTVGWCRSLKRLDGKTVIVTGANAGLGLETAKDFARRGGRVILACRNLQRGGAAVDEIVKETGNKNVVVKQLDLTCLASVRKFAAEINAEESRLDVLVNNAGGYTVQKEITEDKLESIFQSNHFGPFLLTNLLLDLMRKTGNARIVMVSSRGHSFARTLDVKDLNCNNSEWAAQPVYSRTKLANILMAKELQRRLRNADLTGITINSLDPGAVRTSILSNTDSWMFKIQSLILTLYGKSVLEGAQTSIYVAVSEEIEGISGEYFADCQKSGASNLAKDAALATELWEASVKAVALKSNETIV